MHGSSKCKILLAFVTLRKKRQRLRMAAACCFLLLTPALFAVPPTIQIPHIEFPPTLADFEGMQPDRRVSEHMLKVSGFIAREPADGAEPTQNTDVYLASDSRSLYAVFLCWDKEPDKIRARMTRREDIFSDDSAEIMIDTFDDARRGYAFAANPLGIQWDALWTEGSISNGQPADFSGFDPSFDTVWNSEGRMTSQGYMLLISIPFKSLRYPTSDKQQWRIILNRSIPRTNENLFWPRITNRISGPLQSGRDRNWPRGLTRAQHPTHSLWIAARLPRHRPARTDQSLFREPHPSARGRTRRQIHPARQLCSRCDH